MRSALLFINILFWASFANADQVLIRYGFDEGSLPTAKEGFYIFQNSRGFVEPSSDTRFSGYRSLELQEGAMNDGFVELQGVIPPVDKGELLFHFAFLVRNPKEELNIAVAGPNHFSMQKDGMLFWLKTINGVLFHHSDSIPKRLFQLEADTWYVVDAAIHIEKGTYDLRILPSGATTAAALVLNQPNAINLPGSKLSKISFIGDLDDRSTVHYFVDDVELRTLSTPVDLTKWETSGATGSASTNSETSHASERQHIDRAEPSAPLKGFLDEYLELKKLELARVQCIPATHFRDFGVSRDNLKSDSILKSELETAVAAEDLSLPPVERFTRPAAQSVIIWRRGCILLAAGDLRLAEKQFERSRALVPDSSLYRAALAVLASARHDKLSAEEQLVALYTPWAEDARLPVLLGMIASAWSDHQEVSAALSGVAGRMADEKSLRQISSFLVGDNSGFDELKETFGSNWKKELDDLYIGQSYYYSLLFSSHAKEAADFAQKIADKYGQLPSAHNAWLERVADAEFLAGSPCRTKQVLESFVPDCESCESARKKLADLKSLNSCESPPSAPLRSSAP